MFLPPLYYRQYYTGLRRRGGILLSLACSAARAPGVFKYYYGYNTIHARQIDCQRRSAILCGT